MSGVTGDDNTELHTIMSGGTNFVARVTAFYKAKEEAEAAVKKHGDLTNFTTKHAEVAATHAKIADDLRAAEELSQRKRAEAGQLASQMTADAAAHVEKAKAKAEEILVAASKQAAEISSDVVAERAKVQAVSRSTETRASEIARVQLQLDDKRRDLDVAIEAAKQSKDKYDAKFATLTAALAAQE